MKLQNVFGVMESVNEHEQDNDVFIKNDITGDIFEVDVLEINARGDVTLVFNKQGKNE